MLSEIQNCDAWEHAVRMLKATSDSWELSGLAPRVEIGRRKVAGKSIEAQRAAEEPSREMSSTRSLIVRVLEKPTMTTAVVEWIDSTSCRYGNQMWSIRMARAGGVCALSGIAIRIGDVVFQPRLYGPPPCNADEMILSTAIEAAGPMDSGQPFDRSENAVNTQSTAFQH